MYLNELYDLAWEVSFAWSEVTGLPQDRFHDTEWANPTDEND
jgi:hypothetical protein